MSERNGKGGRPSLIDSRSPGDPEGRTVREVILAHLRVGVPFSDACMLAGVKSATVYEWKARGEGTHSRGRTDWYAEFAEQVKEAQAAARAEALAAIREAFHGVMEETVVTVEKPVIVNGRVVVVDGQVLMRSETRTTRGRRVHWQAGAWILERTDTATFGRARVWKDPEPPPVVAESTSEEVAEALERQWRAYELGRGDAAAELAVPDVPGDSDGTATG